MYKVNYEQFKLGEYAMKGFKIEKLAAHEYNVSDKYGHTVYISFDSQGELLTFGY